MTTAPLNIAVPQVPALKAADIPAPSHRALRRALAHRWDLLAVLALLGSSAAIGVFLLLNLAS